MVDCLTVRVCELEQSLCEEQERREELQAENADLLDRMKLAEELCTGESLNFMSLKLFICLNTLLAANMLS